MKQLFISMVVLGFAATSLAQLSTAESRGDKRFENSDATKTSSAASTDGGGNGYKPNFGNNESNNFAIFTSCLFKRPSCLEYKASADESYKAAAEDLKRLEAEHAKLSKELTELSSKNVLTCKVGECQQKEEEYTKRIADLNQKIAARTAEIYKANGDMQVAFGKAYQQQIMERDTKALNAAAKAEEQKQSAAAKVEAQRQKAAELQDLENVRNSATSSFYYLGLRYQNLMAGNLVNMDKLRKFEQEVDNMQMGLYVRSKLQSMLNNSDLMCPSVNRCKSSGVTATTVDDKAMNQIFFQDVQGRTSGGSGTTK